MRALRPPRRTPSSQRDPSPAVLKFADPKYTCAASAHAALKWKVDEPNGSLTDGRSRMRISQPEDGGNAALIAARAYSLVEPNCGCRLRIATRTPACCRRRRISARSAATSKSQKGAAKRTLDWASARMLRIVVRRSKNCLSYDSLIDGDTSEGVATSSSHSPNSLGAAPAHDSAPSAATRPERVLAYSRESRTYSLSVLILRAPRAWRALRTRATWSYVTPCPLSASAVSRTLTDVARSSSRTCSTRLTTPGWARHAR